MSDKLPQILIIPIDNRPVCYDLPKQTAEIFNGLNVFMPNNDLLGGLQDMANIPALNAWAKDILKNNEIDIAIISLDTIAYGGLIPSRRTVATYDEIKKNIDNFIKILTSANKNMKIYATSSIMRISNNNCNEEEKSYWEHFGKDMFRFSFLSHKLLTDYDVELESELIRLAKEIPFEVIDDYLNTRKRNYEINTYYIDLVKKGIFENLVFSQDDTAEYGFNVEEKDLLKKQALKELVAPKVIIKTGADEMVISLLSKALVEYFKENLEIYPVFFNNNAKTIISRYEDVSIEKSADASIKLCGARAAKKLCNLNLLINAPNKVQNDLCLEITEDENSIVQAEKLAEFVKESKSKYMIADIKNANGSDNVLAEKLIEIPYDRECLYGYSAWNTTSNTLGTVIATGIIKYLAKKYNSYNEDAFKKSQYTRFLDDWAYQANVRKTLREKGNNDIIEQEMQPYKDKVSQWLNYNSDTTYSFPWDRTFEVRINIK